MDDLNQRKSPEQVAANVFFHNKEQINRALEEENCEDEKIKHLSDVNLDFECLLTVKE